MSVTLSTAKIINKKTTNGLACKQGLFFVFYFTVYIFCSLLTKLENIIYCVTLKNKEVVFRYFLISKS